MTEGARSAGLEERASGLNEIGAHYFVGWLISAGFQRPEVMAEIEWVLEDMETSPELHHCWMKEDAMAVLADAASEGATPPKPETQAVACENEPRLLAAIHAPPNPLGSPVQFAFKPARQSYFPTRLWEALFGKRVAA